MKAFIRRLFVRLFVPYDRQVEDINGRILSLGDQLAIAKEEHGKYWRTASFERDLNKGIALNRTIKSLEAMLEQERDESERLRRQRPKASRASHSFSFSRLMPLR